MGRPKKYQTEEERKEAQKAQRIAGRLQKKGVTYAHKGRPKKYQTEEERKEAQKALRIARRLQKKGVTNAHKGRPRKYETEEEYKEAQKALRIARRLQKKGVTYAHKGRPRKYETEEERRAAKNRHALESYHKHKPDKQTRLLQNVIKKIKLLKEDIQEQSPEIPSRNLDYEQILMKSFDQLTLSPDLRSKLATQVAEIVQSL